MEITIEYSAKERLEKFLSWLKKRAEDKVHKNNGDIIADFVEKVVVVELKRLENDTETITEEIEIPNEVMTEPLKEMKKRFDKTFKDFMEGNGIDSSENVTEDEMSEADKQLKAMEREGPISPETEKQLRAMERKPRNGNGHEKKKKRELTDNERDTIRSEFMALNGQIIDDACVAIKNNLDPEVAIFQITGFVTSLHKEVREGKTTLKNMNAYEEFLQKHRALWATYNSPKYIAMRQHV